MYSISVSDFPGPERGVSCIKISDIISRNALVRIIIIREINY